MVLIAAGATRDASANDRDETTRGANPLRAAAKPSAFTLRRAEDAVVGLLH
jgi:hypothetical protein